MKTQGEVILYRPSQDLKIEVRIEEDTVWLSRKQLAILFNRDVKTIGKHINNALNEELKSLQVVAKFATTAADGKRYQTEHYNLDMILSVGYRVKSKQGVLFRQWANKVLKEYLLKGYSINYRLRQLEQRTSLHEKQLAQHQEKIDFFIRTSLPPVEGVFCDGQIFDAYVFVADLVKRARQSVVLVDNYLDESVLDILAKRGEGVEATILTSQKSRQLRLDLEKFNSQYPPIALQHSKNIHDRFLIIDDEVYHIGASLKDLGKRLFAFSRMEIGKQELLNHIAHDAD